MPAGLSGDSLDPTAHEVLATAHAVGGTSLGWGAGDLGGYEEEGPGPFNTGGKELRPKGRPEEVRGHDFKD